MESRVIPIDILTGIISKGFDPKGSLNITIDMVTQWLRKEYNIFISIKYKINPYSDENNPQIDREGEILYHNGKEVRYIHVSSGSTEEELYGTCFRTILNSSILEYVVPGHFLLYPWVL